jgi:hypothetical protein
MNLLINLWIILFYLGNTENYLVIADLNYIQIDFLGMLFYYYPYKNNLISDYPLVLFYCRPINNNK